MPLSAFNISSPSTIFICSVLFKFVYSFSSFIFKEQKRVSLFEYSSLASIKNLSFKL